MTAVHEAVLPNMFLREPEETEPVESRFRRIQTPLPAPETMDAIRRTSALFPQVNCYQPPILWDSADGFTVRDKAGNQWIDFTSTAVMTNTGHGHPAIREAVRNHVDSGGLMAQFSFASEIRIDLAERLLQMSPDHCDKVWFWTVGSEANECALRLAREQGLRIRPDKVHVLTHQADYHGWTLGAHQVSGDEARKSWLPAPDPAIHHIPFPYVADVPAGSVDWSEFLQNSLSALASSSIDGDNICAVFIEAFQGWRAMPLPSDYVQALRNWADAHDTLLIFDEVQTGFARTGKLFAHEHYGVRADLICIGKGLTSSLPLAAVLGPGEILDLLPPGEITTTHAAHPVSCAAAIANLDVIESENLIEESARKGEIAARELQGLHERFSDTIKSCEGMGLLRGIHLHTPHGETVGRELSRDWTWESVKRGVMLFQVNKPTLKVVPPLVIDDDALVEGIQTLGEALASVIAV